MGFVIKFKNRNYEPEVNKVDCSQKVINIYELQYDKDHIVKVVESGTINIYDKIQSFANDNDMAKILKTIEITGQPELFKTTQVADIDLTSLPQDLVEAKKIVDEAKSIEKKVKESEIFHDSGLTFDEFVKQYTLKTHVDYLLKKAKEKEVKE